MLRLTARRWATSTCLKVKTFDVPQGGSGRRNEYREVSRGGDAVAEHLLLRGENAEDDVLDLGVAVIELEGELAGHAAEGFVVAEHESGAGRDPCAEAVGGLVRASSSSCVWTGACRLATEYDVAHAYYLVVIAVGDDDA